MKSVGGTANYSNFHSKILSKRKHLVGKNFRLKTHPSWRTFENCHAQTVTTNYNAVSTTQYKWILLSHNLFMRAKKSIKFSPNSEEENISVLSCRKFVKNFVFWWIVGSSIDWIFRWEKFIWDRRRWNANESSMESMTAKGRILIDIPSFCFFLSIYWCRQCKRLHASGGDWEKFSNFSSCLFFTC